MRLITGLLLIVLATPLTAQKMPKRPRFGSDVDTNDAMTYLDYGSSRTRDVWGARDAFYWATRLEPDAAILRFALYHASLNRQTLDWQRRYLITGDKLVLRSKEARQLDSLLDEVMVRDPFTRLTIRCPGNLDIDRERDRMMVGYVYYETGCFDKSVAATGEALAKDPDLLIAHWYRALAFYHLDQYDSTVTELSVLTEALRERDEKALEHVYQSKAMFEYMIGYTRQQQGDLPGAREAFGRALTEDLSFTMAHARLAQVALKDSRLDDAVAEYDLAVGLSPNDGALRFAYGTALLNANRTEPAETQLREAIRLEPYWALPHFNLATALQMEQRVPEAIDEYEAFLALSPKRLASQRLDAARRVSKLKRGR